MTPDGCGLVWCRVCGTSMAPGLRPGQRVFVRLHPSRDSLKAGDILAMRAPEGLLVIHRLVSSEGGLRTCGDNKPAPDPPWDEAALWGILVGAQAPAGGWLEPRKGPARLFARLCTLPPRRLTRRLQHLLAFLLWRPRRDFPEVPTDVQANKDDRWEVQRLGDEWAVYDRQQGSMHILNATAGHIWNRTREGLDTGRIVADLQAQYPQASRTQLEDDVLRTVSELRTKNLIP